MSCPRASGGRKSASAAAGLDFTLHMRRLCDDLCARLDPLAHIDMRRVAIRYCQTRRSTRHGLYASLTPLRFEGGLLHTRRRGRSWTVERLYDDSGREMLYLLSFYLPRFFDRPFDEKLATVVHELWHVSPTFDGDLRRHEGRCYAHGPSQKAYDAHVGRLAAAWQTQGPPGQVAEFLRYDYAQLVSRYGRVIGQRIRTPRLIPVRR